MHRHTVRNGCKLPAVEHRLEGGQRTQLSPATCSDPPGAPSRSNRRTASNVLATSALLYKLTGWCGARRSAQPSNGARPACSILDRVVMRSAFSSTPGTRTASLGCMDGREHRAHRLAMQAKRYCTVAGVGAFPGKAAQQSRNLRIGRACWSKPLLDGMRTICDACVSMCSLHSEHRIGRCSGHPIAPGELAAIHRNVGPRDALLKRLACGALGNPERHRHLQLG